MKNGTKLAEADPVEEAKQEVIRLFGLEAKFTEDLKAKRQAVCEQEATLGDCLIDNGDNTAATRDLMLARVEVESVERAIVAARKRRVDAIRAAFRTEAEQLHAEAEGMRAHAAKIRESCGPLLAELSKLEDIQFDHSVLNGQRIGAWFSDPLSPKALSEANPLEARREPVSDAGWATPRSASLLAGASAIDGRAAMLQERDPNKTVA